MKDVYEVCPVLENEQFCLRLIEEKDAEDLLETYGDKMALPFFNSDNCNGSNFYNDTVEGMREAIHFWLWAYNRRDFVRFTIVDKKRGKAIGTIELFNRKAEDFFNDCGLLRLDVASKYETRESLEQIFSLIVASAYELFGCSMLATKAPLYAIERSQALEKLGFAKTEQYLLGQHDGRRYYDYWILEARNH